MSDIEILSAVETEEGHAAAIICGHDIILKLAPDQHFDFHGFVQGALRDTVGSELDRLRTALAEAERERDRLRAEVNAKANYELVLGLRIAKGEAGLAAAREALEQIVQKDKRFDWNNTMQDTGEDGPCGKIARAFLERTALQGHRRTEEGT